MPVFGEPEQLPSFPSWATAPILNKIGRHPHPGTNRIDGRIVWPADSLQRSLATRQYGRLLWDVQQPAGDPPIYTRWENLWWDWQASGPGECFAWTDTTNSGRKALLRMRWYPSLPIAGIPGTEFYCEAFVQGTSIGIRTIEMPDDTDAFQFNSSIPVVAPDAGHVNPPKTDPIGPNEWFWIETNALSECWRWFNSHRTTQCPYEADGNGMGALAVEMDGWHWGENKYDNGIEYTQKQLEFAEKVNSRHICTPVYLRPIGWIPCEVQYQSPLIWDPDYIGPLLSVGAYYGFTYQVTFGNGTWRVFLHIRVYSDGLIPPGWEIWSSRGSTSGLFQLLGIDGRLMNAVNVMPAPPYESRNADQYQFSGTMFNVPAFGPFGLNDLGEGTVQVKQLKPNERGLEPPLQGPLGMPQKRSQLLIPSDGVNRSISTETAMTFGSPYIQVDTWWDSQTPQDIVVPIGVRAIRGVAQASVTPSSGSATFKFLNITNPWDMTPYNGTRAGGSVQTRQKQVSIPRLPVNEGDVLRFTGRSTNEEWGASQDLNWVQLEGITAQVQPVDRVLVAPAAAIPAAATQLWITTISPSLDGYQIRNLFATLGDSKSTSGHVQIALAWLRFAGRTIEDITDDPLQIDQDHWTSDTSVAPETIHANAETALAGDILIASVVQTGTGATGLAIQLELEEP